MTALSSQNFECLTAFWVHFGQNEKEEAKGEGNYLLLTEWGSLWRCWWFVFPPSQCPAVYRAQSGNLKGHTKTEEILT